MRSAERPDVLSRELRLGTGEFIDHRRGIVALSMAAAGAMGLVVLYQMGVIKRLPEPSLPWLDADRVDAAEEACGMLSTRYRRAS